MNKPNKPETTEYEMPRTALGMTPFVSEQPVTFDMDMDMDADPAATDASLQDEARHNALLDKAFETLTKLGFSAEVITAAFGIREPAIRAKDHGDRTQRLVVHREKRRNQPAQPEPETRGVKRWVSRK